MNARQTLTEIVTSYPEIVSKDEMLLIQEFIRETGTGDQSTGRKYEKIYQQLVDKVMASRSGVYALA